MAQSAAAGFVPPQTSLASSEAPVNEVTVRFRRFHLFQNTAYQRAQEAGLPPHLAEDLARRGIAQIVHDRRVVSADAGLMIRK